MSTSFLDALDDEIQELERQLQADPVYLKLQQVLRTRAVYAGEDHIPAPATVIFSKGSLQITQRRKRAGSPERQAILEQARKLIQGRAYPTPTAEIFDALNLILTIPGKDPKNNLSAMLSNSSDFVSHGRSGWTLAQTQEAPDVDDQINTPEASNTIAASLPAEPNVRPVNPWSGGGT